MKVSTKRQKKHIHIGAWTVAFFMVFMCVAPMLLPHNTGWLPFQPVGAVDDSDVVQIFELNEGSGTYVDNSAPGKGNCWTNADWDRPTFKDDEGKCLDFAGSSAQERLHAYDYTDYSFITSERVDTSFSVEFWFYWEDNDETMYIFSKYDYNAANGGREYHCRITTSGYIQVHLFKNDSASNYIKRQTSIALQLNSWYYVAITYDGTEIASGIHFYLNGIKRDGTTWTVGSYAGMSNTGAVFDWGRLHTAYNNYYLDGRLDKIKVFKGRQFTDSEVSARYWEYLDDSLCASSYSTGGFTDGVKATGVNDDVGAWLGSYQAPGWLKLSDFTSGDLFTRTSTVTVKFRWKMSSSAPYDMYEISAHYNDKSVSDYGYLSYTSWVWSSLSLSGDEITNLKYLYVYFRYLSTDIEGPPFPKLYVDCVKVEYEEITPVWYDTSTSFKRLTGGIASQPNYENVTDNYVYNWSDTTKLYSKAFCESYGNGNLRWAEFDMMYTFADTSGDEIIFDVPSDDTYYLFWDISIDYDVIGSQQGPVDPDEWALLRTFHHIGFSAYKSTTEDIPLTISHEINEWVKNAEDLELQDGDPEYKSGTKKILWSRVGKALSHDEYVCFTLDADIMAKAMTTNSNDRAWVTVCYDYFTVKMYVFSW
ncbi:MAG: LamG domain-containing protein [Candidatus Hermodarchaeota archaeon]